MRRCIWLGLLSLQRDWFLAGDHEDKSNLYQIPYKNMVKYMFEMPDDNAFESLYDNLRSQETVSFWSTSFIRGVTLDKCVMIVDEFSNLNFHELTPSSLVLVRTLRLFSLVTTHSQTL